MYFLSFCQSYLYFKIFILLILVLWTHCIKLFLRCYPFCIILKNNLILIQFSNCFCLYLETHLTVKISVLNPVTFLSQWIFLVDFYRWIRIFIFIIGYSLNKNRFAFSFSCVCMYVRVCLFLPFRFIKTSSTMLNNRDKSGHFLTIPAFCKARI
jgi:hypothetical protein